MVQKMAPAGEGRTKVTAIPRDLEAVLAITDHLLLLTSSDLAEMGGVWDMNTRGERRKKSRQRLSWDTNASGIISMTAISMRQSTLAMVIMAAGTVIIMATITMVAKTPSSPMAAQQIRSGGRNRVGQSWHRESSILVV